VAPSIDTTKVLIGTAILYTAPANTAAPADTIADGTTWASPWTYVGATEEGVSLAVGTDTGDIRVEEQSTPVLIVVNAKNVRILAALSEDTIENMKLAYGGGTLTTTAAATGIPGTKKLVLSNSVSILAAGFEGVNSYGFYRRVYIPQVLSVADVTTPYRRAANNRAYNIELRAVCDPSLITITDKTAIAL
jgi:hypothetical protein